MGSIDLKRVERRARLGYELGRLRRALVGVLPVVAITAIALCFSRHTSSTLGFGVAAALVGAGMLWFGRDPQRAVLPGFAAGLVPLVLALCANHMHVCGPEGCASLCVPACALGGVLAGLGVASVGNQRRAGPWFWVSASTVALLTGAMGCACIGYSGLVGLGIGFGAGMVPGLFGGGAREKSG